MPFQLSVNNFAALFERPSPRAADGREIAAPAILPDANDTFVAPTNDQNWRTYAPTYKQVGDSWNALCCGAQPYSRRLFARRLDPCHESMTEVGLESSLDEHKASTKYEKRIEFFHNFNRYLAPRLTMEESFLQVLAQRFAYTKMLPSNEFEPYWFNCHVSTDLRNSVFAGTRHQYYTSYHVHQAEENPIGCTAFWLEPGTNPGLKNNNSPRIVLFRGTYNYENRDVLTQNAPTGWPTNLDPDNIGHRAFNESRTRLLSWVTHCVDRKQPVVITGHSLGGAQAQQLLAALPNEQQAWCRLVTFGAPGVSAKTVKDILVESEVDAERRRSARIPSPIKMIWHEADPVVHLFGRAFPLSEGIRIIAHVEWNEMLQTHSRLYLLLAEAWRGEIYYRNETRPQTRINALEDFRQFFGAFATSRITADWPFH